MMFMMVMVILWMGMVMATLNLQGKDILPGFNWWKKIKLKLLEDF